MKLGKRFSKIGNITTKRLRNKCAMTDYVHKELVSASCDLNPSPAFQAPSPQVARGKIRSIGNMNKNIFYNKVYSLFTTHLFIAIWSFYVSLLTFHLKQLVLIQTLHLVIYPTNNFKSAEPKRITPTTIATTEANITAPAEISLAIPTNLEYRL